MKKYILAFLALALFNINSDVFAKTSSSLFSSDRREIKTILNKHAKELSKHNVEGIRPFYDKEYISSDGFDLKDMESMLKKTFDSYDNIKSTTKINNIEVFDSLAIAQICDNTYAKIYPPKIKRRSEKMGLLEGRSVYVVYLKKEKDSWKIIYDDILMEETSLKYGIANKIKMDLAVPAFVDKGEEYDIILKMDKPEDVVALASLSREEIVYPPKDYQEKFRKYPESGNLERLVRANKNNLDEYAIASIGFTKVSLNEEVTRARIEVLGMAYIMKRINMKEEKKLPERKEDKQKVIL